MKRIIKVKAPGTVSNVGSGYDIMGFAFEGAGDIMELELNDSGKIELENLCDIDLPTDKRNVVYPCLKEMIKVSGTTSGIKIRFLEKISPGSGIGSSAASSVAAVFGFNILLGKIFKIDQLIDFAMEGETLVSGQKHADNVAPCMLGGFTVIRSYNPLDIVNIPYPLDLVCSVVHPDIEIKTLEARKLIKNMIPIKDTITQTGNAASLIAGLILDDKSLIGRSVTDVIAEPARAGLIPFYNTVKEKAFEMGALAFSISGSGPSVFAFSDTKEKGEKIAIEISKVFLDKGIRSNSYVSNISSTGVREIS